MDLKLGSGLLYNFDGTKWGRRKTGYFGKAIICLEFSDESKEFDE